MQIKTLFVICCMQSIILHAQNFKMFVGTYNTDTVKNGIYVYEFNKKTGNTKLISNLPLSNPTFLTVANNKNIYTVLENATAVGYSGEIAALDWSSKNNKLTILNKVSSMGNNPCHIVTDYNSNYAVAANYTSGNFCIYKIEKNGNLGKLVQNIQHKGSSKDTSRQQSAHAHGVYLNSDNTQLYVPDLGMDKVMCYNFDANTGATSPFELPFLEMNPGSGPRHLAIHPNGNYMYVIQELTGKVNVYYKYNNHWVFLDAFHSEPNAYTGKSSGAEIIISKDGKFLYVSNRGTSNTIAIFKVDSKTGAIDLLGHQSCMGLKPRFMNFDPSNNFLLVANQDSNNIIVFKRNAKTGMLIDTKQNIIVPKPVCIAWVE